METAHTPNAEDLASNDRTVGIAGSSSGTCLLLWKLAGTTPEKSQAYNPEHRGEEYEGVLQWRNIFEFSHSRLRPEDDDGQMRALSEYMLDNVVEYVVAQDPVQQTAFMNFFLRFVALMVAEVTTAIDRGRFIASTKNTGAMGPPAKRPDGPGDGFVTLQLSMYKVASANTVVTDEHSLMQQPATGEDTEKLFLRVPSLVQRLLDALPRHEANACAQVLLDWLVWSRTQGQTPMQGVLHDRAFWLQAMLATYVGSTVPMGSIDAVLAKVRTWMGTLAPLLQVEVSTPPTDMASSSGAGSSSDPVRTDPSRWSDWEKWALQQEQDTSRVKKKVRVHVPLRTVNEESLALGSIETWVDSQAAVQIAFRVEETLVAMTVSSCRGFRHWS